MIHHHWDLAFVHILWYIEFNLFIIWWNMLNHITFIVTDGIRIWWSLCDLRLMHGYIFDYPKTLTAGIDIWVSLRFECFFIRWKNVVWRFPLLKWKYSIDTLIFYDLGLIDRGRDLWLIIETPIVKVNLALYYWLSKVISKVVKTEIKWGCRYI